MRGGTPPPRDKPPRFQKETQFPADNPPMIREAFPADLLGTPAFTHRMDQLDAVGVDDAEHGRGGQESPRPVLMGFEETKEAGALRGVGRQQPEGSRPHPSKRKGA